MLWKFNGLKKYYIKKCHNYLFIICGRNQVSFSSTKISKILFFYIVIIAREKRPRCCQLFQNNILFYIKTILCGKFCHIETITFKMIVTNWIKFTYVSFIYIIILNLIRLPRVYIQITYALIHTHVKSVDIWLALLVY